MTIGERIRQRREAIGMSQDELAKRMGYKDRSSVSKIEKGNDDNIYLDTIQRTADILNCSPLYLMGWQDESDNINDKEIPDHLKKYAQFIDMYEHLNDNNRELVDNMIQALSSKQ
jgi:transcriptional regulator with XRE-family HTH domain